MYPYTHRNAQIITASKNTCVNVIDNLKKDTQLLQLLSSAYIDAQNTAAVYSTLSRRSDLGANCEIIRNAYLDQLKHIKLIQEIYYEITGQTTPPSTEKITPVKSPPVKDINTTLESLLFEEMECADFYRDLLLLMPNGQLWNNLFEMLTDKQDHCIRICFLLQKQK